MSKGAKTKLFDAIAALFQCGPSQDGSDENEDYAAFLALTGPDEEELARERTYEPPDPVRFVIAVLGMGRESREAARTLASVEAQTYRHFEVTDDPVPAKGDYVLALCAGDMLTPDALYRFMRRIEVKPHVKLLYADEDCLVKGKRCNPVLKPAYSQVTALSYDLFGAPVVVSKALYDLCAPSDAEEFKNPGESYAFALRCLEKAGFAEHIERVLLTRAAPPRQAGNSEGCAAIEHYLKRNTGKYVVSGGLWRGSFHVAAQAKNSGKVAVIIPNRNGADELRRLLESIEETCAFYEPLIVIADAGSTSERTLKYYEILEKNGAAKIITVKKGGFSRLCNAAATAAPVEDYLFIARDAEIFTPDLIGEMRAQAGRLNTGAVGCMLTDENGRLVHAGYVAGLCGAAESPYAGESELEGSLRKLTFVRTLRGVSCVSGACMYIKSSVFHGAGCFDESFDGDREFLPCGADLELCVRLMRKGLTNIYTPFARAVLHAKLPGIGDAADKIKMRCYDTLRPVMMAGDPYFNRNYSKNSRIPRVRTEPEDEPPEKF